jgi:hypothetical protein
MQGLRSREGLPLLRIWSPFIDSHGAEVAVSREDAPLRSRVFRQNRR